jgi:hypothetical protein
VDIGGMFVDYKQSLGSFLCFWGDMESVRSEPSSHLLAVSSQPFLAP